MAHQSKPVSFNIDTEKELLTYANTLNFSSYVKEKIRKDLLLLQHQSSPSQNELPKIHPPQSSPAQQKSLVWKL